VTHLPALMVAPNGATRTKADHPAVPLSVAETVATARACFEAGAGGLHAHVRDTAGRHVLDAGLYRDLLDAMAEGVPGMAVQVTTEAQGRYVPAEMRAMVAELQPAMVSVALREMLADDDTRAARAFYHDADAAGMAVQHILYDTADVRGFHDLRRDGTLPDLDAPQVLLVLGRYADGQQATPADLDAPLAALLGACPGADWAVCAFGARETACLQAARKRGGKCRVGFENNLLNADGRPARDNADRVAEVVAALCG